MQTSLYRAVWRWHFYAGLLALPVLVWLATTGGLYLYKPEIERLVYAQELSAPRPEGAAILPPSRLVAAVEGATDGTVTQIVRPEAADESWRLTVELLSGERRMAFVNPWTAEVTGIVGQGGVMRTVRDLHSLIITGPVGNAVVELAAGWAIVLAVSGIWLWWPSGGSPAFALRGGPKGRLFWRDLHAGIGVVAGGVVLFLAVTGMPWSGIWGKGLQIAVAASGVGRPETPGPKPWEMAKRRVQHDHVAETLPWGLQAAGAPIGGGQGDIGVDRAVAIAADRGVAAPWTLSRPLAAGDPYLVSTTAKRAEDAHVLYLDAATGRVLQDVRADAFGPGARAIEWGVAVHQGEQYGEINRLLMVAGCLGMVGLAGSGVVMWWKRRPERGLGAPPAPENPRAVRAVAIPVGIAGLVFPMVGASLLAALAIEGALGLRRRATG